MDIHNLQAFIEVAEKKSFSRSAESLNLTQPAVSKRIAALEAELSSRLFDRMGRSVRLTEAGRVLLPSAIKIYSEVSRIEDEICNLGKEVKGKLIIGLEEHVAIDRLTPIIKAFRDDYPGADIDMRFNTTEETLVSVERSVVDLGFCSIGSNFKNGKAYARLRDVELWSDQLVVVAAKSHPLARMSAVSISELAEYSAILPHKNCVMRKALDNAMLENHATALVALETQDVQTAQSMASIGIGWALLPESAIDDTLAKLNVEGLSLKHSVGLVRNSDRSLSRVAKAFLDSLPASYA